MGMTIDVRDEASAALKAMGAKLRDVNPVIGRAARNCIRDNFRTLEQTHPNKNNWTRQHFWADCARATNFTLGPDTVTVNVSKPGALLQLEGGVVEAGKHTSSATGKPTKFLTIPARAEAYGRRAGEFHNLEYAMTDQGPALVERSASSVSYGSKRKDGTKRVFNRGETGGAVFYWLRKRVKIGKHPEVLPTEFQMRVAIRNGVQELMDKG